MKVFEFLRICPSDHDITIYFHTTNREVFLPNKTEIRNPEKGILYKEINEEIAFVMADGLKSFYISTIIE